MYPAKGSLFPLLLPGQVALVKLGFSRLNKGDSPHGCDRGLWGDGVGVPKERPSEEPKARCTSLAAPRAPTCAGFLVFPGRLAGTPLTLIHTLHRESFHHSGRAFIRLLISHLMRNHGNQMCQLVSTQ